MGFFKKDEIKQKEVQVVNEIKTETKAVQTVSEIKTETKEADRGVHMKKKLSLFDVDTIDYVIKNFPSMSIEIQTGLNNLADILENTIDYIEDESKAIIKKNRDFKLSKAHRDASVAIYDIVQNLSEYVNWMQDEYEKKIKNEETKLDQSNPQTKIEIQEKHVEEKKHIEEKKNEDLELSNIVIGEDENKDLSNTILGEEIEIYKDFSLKEPKAFRLDNNVVTVEDWNDLLVKTAEVLTKQYRKNKYSNSVIKQIKPIAKKSVQNSFRDTAIEMLTEYKIKLDNFKIIIK